MAFHSVQLQSLCVAFGVVLFVPLVYFSSSFMLWLFCNVPRRLSIGNEAGKPLAKDSRQVRRRLAREQKRHRASETNAGLSLRIGRRRVQSFPVTRQELEQRTPVYRQLISIFYWVGGAKGNYKAQLPSSGGPNSWFSCAQPDPFRPNKITQKPLNPPIAPTRPVNVKERLRLRVKEVATYVRFLLLFKGANVDSQGPTLEPVDDQNSPNPSSSRHDEATQRNERRTGKGNRNKRKRPNGSDNNSGNQNDDSDQDDDNEFPAENDHGHENDGDKTLERFMACFCYKFDPHTYKRCLCKYKMKRFADVKQHFLRCHVVKGDYYCLTCRVDWPTKEPWQDHMRKRNCQNINKPELFFTKETECLKKVPRGLNDEEKWFWTWQCLYPDRPPPESAYYIDSEIAETAVLREQAHIALQSRLPSLLERHFSQSSIGETSSLVDDIIQVVFTLGTCSIPRLPRRISSGDHNTGTSGETEMFLASELVMRNDSWQSLPATVTVPSTVEVGRSPVPSSISPRVVARTFICPHMNSVSSTAQDLIQATHLHSIRPRIQENASTQAVLSIDNTVENDSGLWSSFSNVSAGIEYFNQEFEDHLADPSYANYPAEDDAGGGTSLPDFVDWNGAEQAH